MYLLNTYYAQNGKSNTVKILKNREFESLRPRIWREIAERKPRVRENRELGNREVGGISVLSKCCKFGDLFWKVSIESC